MQLVLNTYTSSSPLSSNFNAKGRSQVRTFWISPDWYKLVIEPERSIRTNTLARWELKSMFFSFFSRTMWRSRPSSALLSRRICRCSCFSFYKSGIASRTARIIFLLKAKKHITTSIALINYCKEYCNIRILSYLLWIVNINQ